MFQSLALQFLTDLHYFFINFTKTSEQTTAYGLNTSATEYTAFYLLITRQKVLFFPGIFVGISSANV